MVNASANNRLFYAWSADGEGLGVGTKRSTSRYFPTDLAVRELTSPLIGTYAGGSAQYPSINTYSNIAQGHEQASVVWQEGGHIRYTRLRADPDQTTIRNYLPVLRSMNYSGYAPGIPRATPLDSIAIMSDTLVAADNSMPVISRSLIADTMNVYIKSAVSDLDDQYPYQHESIAWQQFLTDTHLQRSQIQHRQFFDVSTVGAFGQLYFWRSSTTYGGGVSLFHPVQTQGIVRLDTLVWEGWTSDTTFVTYADSLQIKGGNVSDSAVILDYNILTKAQYLEVRAARTANQATWWQGTGRFANTTTQQIFLRLFPALPAPPAPPTLHFDFLWEGGTWPHLAARQRENSPPGLQAVRRVLQNTTGTTPGMLSSAEGFYKVTGVTGVTGVTEVTGGAPAVSVGYLTSSGDVAIEAVLDDGRRLRLYPDPERLNARSAFGPTQLVSEPFSVETLRTLHVLATGVRRKGTQLTVEEFCATCSDEGVLVELPANVQRSAYNNKRMVAYLTEGGGKQYRLRFSYTGSDPFVYSEVVNINPEVESFEKSSQESNNLVVNLSSHRTALVQNNHAVELIPNPATERLLVVASCSPSESSDANMITITVFDLLGTSRLQAGPTANSCVVFDVRSLEPGTYRVDVQSADGHLCGSSTAVIIR